MDSKRDDNSKKTAKKEKEKQRAHQEGGGEEPKPGASAVAPMTALEPGAAAMTTRAAAERVKAMESSATANTAKATAVALDKKIRTTVKSQASTQGAASSTQTNHDANERDIQQKINAQTISTNKIGVDDDGNTNGRTTKNGGNDEVNQKEGSKDLKVLDKSSELMDKNKSSEFMEKDIESADNNVVETEHNRGRTQGPSVVAAAAHSMAKDKDKEDEKELAVAVLVEDDEKEVVDARADIYDGESKPFYTRPIFWIFIVTLILIVGIVIGVTVAVAGGDDDDKSGPTVAPTDSPTASPTASPTRQGVSVLSLRLQEVVGSNLHLSSPEAFESAVQWFFDDPNKYTNITFIGVDETIRRSLQEEGIPRMLNIQRFALAWFWFHSTANGEEPWLSCNPPGVVDVHDGEVGGETCTHLSVSVAERPEQEVFLCYTDIPDVPRWLSSAPECTWPGVICDDYADVSRLISHRQ